MKIFLSNHGVALKGRDGVRLQQKIAGIKLLPSPQLKKHSAMVGLMKKNITIQSIIIILATVKHQSK